MIMMVIIIKFQCKNGKKWSPNNEAWTASFPNFYNVSRYSGPKMNCLYYSIGFLLPFVVGSVNATIDIVSPTPF